MLRSSSPAIRLRPFHGLVQFLVCVCWIYWNHWNIFVVAAAVVHFYYCQCTLPNVMWLCTHCLLQYRATGAALEIAMGILELGCHRYVVWTPLLSNHIQFQFTTVTN